MIKNILCVDKGNACRSPMLAVLLRDVIQKMLPERSDIVVESAGTYVDMPAGSPATPHAIQCMKERGINITEHQSKSITGAGINIQNFDLIVCMTSAEAEFVLKLNPRGAILVANATKGGIPNPYEKDLIAYRVCAEALESASFQIICTFLV